MKKQKEEQEKEEEERKKQEERRHSKKVNLASCRSKTRNSSLDYSSVNSWSWCTVLVPTSSFNRKNQTSPAFLESPQSIN